MDTTVENHQILSQKYEVKMPQLTVSVKLSAYVNLHLYLIAYISFW